MHMIMLAGLILAGAPSRAAEAPPLPFVDSRAATKTVNKIALRMMFTERRFAELTTALEGLQAIADADCEQELLGLDAFETFYCGDPQEPALFDEWVKASPQSYAPLVARGSWYFALAEQRHGKDWASRTSKEQWKSMKDRPTRMTGNSIAPLRLDGWHNTTTVVTAIPA